jgi:hypothetical protein
MIESGLTIKAIVVDTFTRICNNYTNSKGFTQKGGFEKWDTFANNVFEFLNIVKRDLPNDVVVYLMAHPREKEDENFRKSLEISLPGKKTYKQGGVESYSSIVIYTQKVPTSPGQPDEYTFRVNNYATAKTPLTMFPDSDNIPNDLGLVDDAVRKLFKI